MKLARLLAALFTLSLAASAHTYELATHGRLTHNTYLQSALAKDGMLLKELGLEIQNSITDEPFGTVYFDFTDSETRTRYANTFESSNGRMPDGVKSLSLPGWLMRGAIREDDAYKEANPQDDPYPANTRLRRPLHHFYDPIHDCGLFVGSCSQNLIETGFFGLGSLDPDVHKATDWALGTSDVFADANNPEAARRNHFTLFDAREALYRALTSKNRDGDVVAATDDERKAYWATTFRALGDVMHLVEDMAQPQHTRNDRHAGKTPESVSGHESVYEKYIEAWTEKNASRGE